MFHYQLNIHLVCSNSSDPYIFLLRVEHSPTLSSAFVFSLYLSKKSLRKQKALTRCTKHRVVGSFHLSPFRLGEKRQEKKQRMRNNNKKEKEEILKGNLNGTLRKLSIYKFSCCNNLIILKIFRNQLQRFTSVC